MVNLLLWLSKSLKTQSLHTYHCLSLSLSLFHFHHVSRLFQTQSHSHQHKYTWCKDKLVWKLSLVSVQPNFQDNWLNGRLWGQIRKFKYVINIFPSSQTYSLPQRKGDTSDCNHTKLWRQRMREHEAILCSSKNEQHKAIGATLHQ